MSLITVTCIVGRLLGGELCNRMSARYVWAGSLGVLLLGTLSLMFAKSIPLMAIYTVCTGFGCAFVCMPVVYSKYFSAKIYGSLFGTLFPSITLCSSASPAIAGKLFDASGSYTSAFVLVIAFHLLGIVSILLVKPPKTV